MWEHDGKTYESPEQVTEALIRQMYDDLIEAQKADENVKGWLHAQGREFVKKASEATAKIKRDFKVRPRYDRKSTKKTASTPADSTSE